MAAAAGSAGSAAAAAAAAAHPLLNPGAGFGGGFGGAHGGNGSSQFEQQARPRWRRRRWRGPRRRIFSNGGSITLVNDTFTANSANGRAPAVVASTLPRMAAPAWDMAARSSPSTAPSRPPSSPSAAIPPSRRKLARGPRWYDIYVLSDTTGHRRPWQLGVRHTHRRHPRPGEQRKERFRRQPRQHSDGAHLERPVRPDQKQQPNDYRQHRPDRVERLEHHNRLGSDARLPRQRRRSDSDHGLLAGSPAIRAGITTDYPGTSTPITTDQRGDTRAATLISAPTTTTLIDPATVPVGDGC